MSREPVLGLMQDAPLLIASLLEYAARNHGSAEIVTCSLEKRLHRYTYREAHDRTKQLAKALQQLGIEPGDRVGTLAWNTYRHFECFYGVSGIGAVLHTINPRLFTGQIEYIINHAEDRYLFVDVDQVPLLEELWPRLTSLKGCIVLTDHAHMPQTVLRGLLCYEELIAAQTPELSWPMFDERSASSLCYTSGTTGHPKGVLYSHRSTLLHALCVTRNGFLGLDTTDNICVVAPMFHANAWSLPYCAPSLGCKLILPGRRTEPQALYELMVAERATFAAAVPTVWNSIIEHLDRSGGDFGSLRKVVIAGVAVARSMREKLRQRYGIEMLQMWGMTEMSPVGTMASATREVLELPEEVREAVLDKQGRLPFGVEMKICNGYGERLPRDGESRGDIWVKGPWVASGYFKQEGPPARDAEGWFPTGDVGTLDEYGYMKITDRTKDVIKSGGEWISSVDIENLVLAHPEVSEAAVVGVKHPKWDERPLLIVKAKSGCQPSKTALLDFLRPQLAKWWLPDDVVLIQTMPYTATGKIRKADLRETYCDWLLPRECTHASPTRDGV